MIHAYAVRKSKTALKPFSYKEPKIGPYDVEIQITHCGLCHSDVHLVDNDWGNAKYPLIPGHEIVGHIVKKGSAVKDLKLKERVGVSWQCGSCLNCDFCLRGDENLCSKKVRTCVDRYGGFADKIVVDSRFAYSIPKKLDSAVAAPLLCAGATVYSPLRMNGIQAHMSVAVIGIGGLGHLALQFAHAFGCEVTAISSTKKKQAEAKKFGANHFLSLQNRKLLEKAAGSFDFILSTVHANLDWNLILSLLRPKGRLCIAGVPSEALKILPRHLISSERSICGTTVGPRALVREMLTFAARHHIAPKIEVLPMSKVNEAIKKLKANKVRYRMVLKNG